MLAAAARILYNDQNSQNDKGGQTDNDTYMVRTLLLQA